MQGVFKHRRPQMMIRREASPKPSLVTRLLSHEGDNSAIAMAVQTRQESGLGYDADCDLHLMWARWAGRLLRAPVPPVPLLACDSARSLLFKDSEQGRRKRGRTEEVDGDAAASARVLG